MDEKVVKADQVDVDSGSDKKVDTLAEIEAVDGLKTVEVGFAADQVLVDLDEKEKTRILRKIDYRLVPLLGVLYLLAFIDRGNIGNAKIAGLYEDLHLHGMQYNTALTLFFVPYGFFEVPSNIVLKILRPSIWISILMFSWGTVMTLMGVISSYQGLLVTRFFLGVAESGFFPAATYLLTIWYLRYEVQRRMAVFYAAASLSGAFSGLLAYGIQHMDGIAGLAGWKWIFIIEGLLPVAGSFFVWFLLPDSPETARFLTKDEKEFIINRLALETGSGHGRVTNSDKIGLRHIVAAFKEWKIWGAVVMFWANTIGVYGFTATVPSVIEELGYTSANAQLMTIPIYVFAMIMTLIFAFWSDRVEQRTPFIMAGFSIAAVGFIGELAIPHPRLPGVTYFFLFPLAAGLYCPFICLVCLIGNNLAPSSKRAVGMALLISVGNFGGIAGSNIYIASQAPKYPTGFGTGLGICVAAVIMAYVLRRAYRAENAKRDAFMVGKTDDEVKAMYTEQELLDMGDKSPFYRYTV
ncbi:putative transporter [Cladophialophora carrionii]|uniref:Putative transporter n=1 Tax=Cladophialophora carrionii TaxID=86049 RepID=A0A1C1CSS8_9EURO|nr:putative transporter [Cladophialophora carrionii]